MPGQELPRCCCVRGRSSQRGCGPGEALDRMSGSHALSSFKWDQEPWALLHPELTPCELAGTRAAVEEVRKLGMPRTIVLQWALG
jgi:hypothetical protein